MKKIILSLAVVLFSLSINARDITITKKNGSGGNMYGYVGEKHTGHWYTFDLASTLRCSGPGTINCGWEYPPMTPGGSVNDLENQIIALIANGQLSGSLSVGGVDITWTAEGVADYTINMHYDD